MLNKLTSVGYIKQHMHGLRDTSVVTHTHTHTIKTSKLKLWDSIYVKMVTATIYKCSSESKAFQETQQPSTMRVLTYATKFTWLTLLKKQLKPA